MRLTNRGRLLLRTLVPVPFETCICSNVETIFSWACQVFGLWISNIPRYFYFALRYLYIHQWTSKHADETSLNGALRTLVAWSLKLTVLSRSALVPRQTKWRVYVLIFVDILILDQQWLPNQSDFPPISWPWYRALPSPIMSGFHGAFATGVACQQGTLTLPDTWFRPPLLDLLVLQLLRPDSSNLPCLYSTFHLEYPSVLSRFCLSMFCSYRNQQHRDWSDSFSLYDFDCVWLVNIILQHVNCTF